MKIKVERKESDSGLGVLILIIIAVTMTCLWKKVSQLEERVQEVYIQRKEIKDGM
jgi:hypothetical protein